jgi:hypothetical protein
MQSWKLLERPLRGVHAVIFCVGISAGLVLGWVAGRWSLPKVDVKWLDVMTAVGTVGATVAAVGIAWWQWFVRNTEQTHKAWLNLTLARAALASAHNAGVEAAEFLTYEYSKKSHASAIECLVFLNTQLQRVDIADMLRLSPTCAHTITHARGAGEQWERLMRRDWKASEEGDTSPIRSAWSLYKGGVGDLELMLSTAREKCGKLYERANSPVL